jgi:hypothetical protein
MVGIVAIGAAYVWWQQFYGAVHAYLGLKDPLPIECLYLTSGTCRIVANVAALAGINAYDPLLFWGGIGALLIGVILNSSWSADHYDTPKRRKRQDRVEPRF